MRLGLATNILGDPQESVNRYTSPPTRHTCKKCNYFWKSPLGQEVCGRKNNLPKQVHVL